MGLEFFFIFFFGNKTSFGSGLGLGLGTEEEVICLSNCIRIPGDRTIYRG